MRHLQRAGRRRERGNVLFIAAAGLLFGLSVAALAIDTGRIAWQKRQLRLQTDLAALAAAWEVGDCRESGGDPLSAASTVAAANGYTGSLASAPNSVTLGRVETVEGLRTFVADASEARAVEVIAFHDVPNSWLLPTLLPGTVPLRAAATARAQALAGFWVGSRTLSVDSEQAEALDAVLGGLLGGAVNVSAIGYDGLMNSQVRLADLVAASDATGTVDEFLASEVTAGEFLDATGQALEAGGEDAAAATVNDMTSSVPADRSFTVGDVLAVSPEAEEAALDSSLDAFGLILASAQAANRQHAVVVDPLALSLPGVASATLRMTVIEPPQIAIGPPGQDADGRWRTEARTSQIRLQLDLDALSNLTLPGISAAVELSLFLEVAPARAHLAWIECARAADPVARIGIGVEPGLLRYGIGSFSDPESDDAVTPVLVAELRLLGIPVARVRASSDASVASPPEELVFEGPIPPASIQTAGGDLASAVDAALADVAGDLGLQVEVLGFLPLGVTAGSIANAATTLLGPIVSGAGEALTPLLLGLGVHAGSADVSVFWVEQSSPELVR